jgi:HSP20 family protein
MEPLKHIVRAWEELTEGWRQLLSRNGGALTHFIRVAKKNESPGADSNFPQWGLLSAETWETARSVIVRIEVPGVKKEDLDVSIHGSTLRIRGEKRQEGGHQGKKYYLMERAYGRFERNITLPQNVASAESEVSYKDGILTVILEKTETAPPRQIPIQ